MKKAALVLSLIFTAVALSVFLLLRQLGPNDAATLVPKTTLLFLNAPDLASTSLQWKTSTFKQLLEEKETTAFVQHSLERLASWTGLFEAPASAAMLEELILTLKPGRFFIAAEPENNTIAWIIGCQFFGSKKAQEKGAHAFLQALKAHYGEETTTVSQLKAGPTEKITQRIFRTITLFSASHGSWSFISNSQDALLTTLDLSRRGTTQESLATTACYQKSQQQVPSKADLYLFIAQHPLLEKIAFLQKDQPLPPILKLSSLPGLKTEGEMLAHATSLTMALSLTPQGMQETLFFQDLKPQEPLLPASATLENHQSRIDSAILLPECPRSCWSPLVMTEKMIPSGVVVESIGPLTIMPLLTLRWLFQEYGKN